MKISTKGKYGLRAMIDLAIYSNSDYISLKSIVERQRISESYLEQIISTLKKAGLVISIRGSQGGYMLSKDAVSITVGDVLRALEGPLAPIGCVIEDDGNECEKSGFCVTRIIWERIRDSITNVVDSITLKDLVDDYNDKADILKEKGEYCNG